MGATEAMCHSAYVSYRTPRVLNNILRRAIAPERGPGPGPNDLRCPKKGTDGFGPEGRLFFHRCTAILGYSPLESSPVYS